MLVWPYGQVSDLNRDFVHTVSSSFDRGANRDLNPRGPLLRQSCGCTARPPALILDANILFANFQSRIKRPTQVLPSHQLARLSLKSNYRGGDFDKLTVPSGGHGPFCLCELATNDKRREYGQRSHRCDTTVSRVSLPSKNFHGTSARHSPSVFPIRYVSCV